MVWETLSLSWVSPLSLLATIHLATLVLNTILRIEADAVPGGFSDAFPRDGSAFQRVSFVMARPHLTYSAVFNLKGGALWVTWGFYVLTVRLASACISVSLPKSYPGRPIDAALTILQRMLATLHLTSQALFRPLDVPSASAVWYLERLYAWNLVSYVVFPGGPLEVVYAVASLACLTCLCGCYMRHQPALAEKMPCILLKEAAGIAVILTVEALRWRRRRSSRRGGGGGGGLDGRGGPADAAAGAAGSQGGQLQCGDSCKVTPSGSPPLPAVEAALECQPQHQAQQQRQQQPKQQQQQNQSPLPERPVKEEEEEEEKQRHQESEQQPEHEQPPPPLPPQQQRHHHPSDGAWDTTAATADDGASLPGPATASVTAATTAATPATTAERAIVSRVLTYPASGSPLAVVPLRPLYEVMELRVHGPLGTTTTAAGAATAAANAGVTGVEPLEPGGGGGGCASADALSLAQSAAVLRSTEQWFGRRMMMMTPAAPLEPSAAADAANTAEGSLAPPPPPPPPPPPRYVGRTLLSCTRVKIRGSQPEQIAAGYRERLAEVVAAAGQQLEGVYVRRGCIELIIDVRRLMVATNEAASAVHGEDLMISGGVDLMEAGGDGGDSSLFWGGAPYGEGGLAAAVADCKDDSSSSGSGGGGGDDGCSGGDSGEGGGSVDIGAVIRALQLPCKVLYDIGDGDCGYGGWEGGDGGGDAVAAAAASAYAAGFAVSSGGGDGRRGGDSNNADDAGDDGDDAGDCAPLRAPAAAPRRVVDGVAAATAAEASAPTATACLTHNSDAAAVPTTLPAAAAAHKWPYVISVHALELGGPPAAAAAAAAAASNVNSDHVACTGTCTGTALAAAAVCRPGGGGSARPHPSLDQGWTDHPIPCDGSAAQQPRVRTAPVPDGSANATAAATAPGADTVAVAVAVALGGTLQLSARIWSPSDQQPPDLCVRSHDRYLPVTTHGSAASWQPAGGCGGYLASVSVSVAGLPPPPALLLVGVRGQLQGGDGGGAGSGGGSSESPVQGLAPLLLLDDVWLQEELSRGLSACYRWPGAAATAGGGFGGDDDDGDDDAFAIRDLVSDLGCFLQYAAADATTAAGASGAVVAEAAARRALLRRAALADLGCHLLDWFAAADGKQRWPLVLERIQRELATLWSAAAEAALVATATDAIGTTRRRKAAAEPQPQTAPDAAAPTLAAAADVAADAAAAGVSPGAGMPAAGRASAASRRESSGAGCRNTPRASASGCDASPAQQHCLNTCEVAAAAAATARCDEGGEGGAGCGAGAMTTCAPLAAGACGLPLTRGSMGRLLAWIRAVQAFCTALDEPEYQSYLRNYIQSQMKSTDLFVFLSIVGQMVRSWQQEPHWRQRTALAFLAHHASLLVIWVPHLAQLATYAALPRSQWGAVGQALQAPRMAGYILSNVLVGYCGFGIAAGARSYHATKAVWIGDALALGASVLVMPQTAIALSVLRIPTHIAMWRALGVPFTARHITLRAAGLAALTAASNLAFHAGLRLALSRSGRRRRGSGRFGTPAAAAVLGAAVATATVAAAAAGAAVAAVAAPAHKRRPKQA